MSRGKTGVNLRPEDRLMLSWLAEQNGVTASVSLRSAIELLHSNLSSYGKTFDEKHPKI